MVEVHLSTAAANRLGKRLHDSNRPVPPSGASHPDRDICLTFLIIEGKEKFAQIAQPFEQCVPTRILEHVLRYTTLALLDSPNTTVLSILKMLTDKNYRQKIISRI